MQNSQAPQDPQSQYSLVISFELKASDDEMIEPETDTLTPDQLLVMEKVPLHKDMLLYSDYDCGEDKHIPNYAWKYGKSESRRVSMTPQLLAWAKKAEQ